MEPHCCFMDNVVKLASPNIMNIIDIIFGIIILFFTFKGFTRGFVAEAIGIISFISAFYYNGVYNGFVCNIISSIIKIEYGLFLRILSFIIFFFIVYVSLKLLSSFLKKIFGGIGVIDNIIGGVALFVLSVVLLGVVSIGIDKVISISSAEDYRITSKIYYPIQNFVKSNIFYFN